MHKPTVLPSCKPIAYWSRLHSHIPTTPSSTITSGPHCSSFLQLCWELQRLLCFGRSVARCVCVCVWRGLIYQWEKRWQSPGAWVENTVNQTREQTGEYYTHDCKNKWLKCSNWVCLVLVSLSHISTLHTRSWTCVIKYIMKPTFLKGMHIPHHFTCQKKSCVISSAGFALVSCAILEHF